VIATDAQETGKRKQETEFRNQKAGWCGLRTSSIESSCLPNRNGNNS
jgi:hypothetical protein